MSLSPHFLRGALFAAALALAGGSAHGGLRAVVVAIGEYPEGLDRLFRNSEGAKNDADAISRWLTSRGAVGDRITVLRDGAASRGKILAAIDKQFVSDASEGDALVFYYSGHGSQVPDFNGDEADGLDEVLVTADFSETRPETWLTDDAIGERFEKVGSSKLIVIYDCCHAGTGTRGVKGHRGGFYTLSRSISRPDASFRDARSKPDHVFFAACGDGQKAWEFYDKSTKAYAGAFTRAFINIAEGEVASQPLRKFEHALRKEVRTILAEAGHPEVQEPRIETTLKEKSLKDLLEGGMQQTSTAPATLSAPSANPGIQTRPITISIETDKPFYRWTEQMTISLSVDTPAFLRLYHCDSAGAITQIYPNAKQPERLISRGETLIVPPEGNPFSLRVTAPSPEQLDLAGRQTALEILLVVASTAPFSDGEANKFVGGLFKTLPGESISGALSRGIAVESRSDAPLSTDETPATGHAIKIYQTFQK